MNDKKYALLIDAENTSVKYVDGIIRELKEYGVVTYKRMYGDFTNKILNEWNVRALDYAIVPIQQPRYSKAKNAADIMLVIDAMDILYQGQVDGFCIVTSDSDFTRLVSRIRESGMFVLGMGKSDASKTFIAACNEYKYLDKIFEEDAPEEQEESGNVTPLEDIMDAIEDIVQQRRSKGDRADLGGIKSSLQRLYPDYDERNYGYTSFRTFISDMDRFEVKVDGRIVHVKVKTIKNSEEEIKKYIVELVSKKSIGLSNLGKLLHVNYPGFSYKSYGYSQLSKFISTIKDVKIDNGKIIYLDVNANKNKGVNESKNVITNESINASLNKIKNTGTNENKNAVTSKNEIADANIKSNTNKNVNKNTNKNVKKKTSGKRASSNQRGTKKNSSSNSKVETVDNSDI